MATNGQSDRYGFRHKPLKKKEHSMPKIKLTKLDNPPVPPKAKNVDYFTAHAGSWQQFQSSMNAYIDDNNFSRTKLAGLTDSRQKSMI